MPQFILVLVRVMYKCKLCVQYRARVRQNLDTGRNLGTSGLVTAEEVCGGTGIHCMYMSRLTRLKFSAQMDPFVTSMGGGGWALSFDKYTI